MKMYNLLAKYFALRVAIHYGAIPFQLLWIRPWYITSILILIIIFSITENESLQKIVSSKNEQVEELQKIVSSKNEEIHELQSILEMMKKRIKDLKSIQERKSSVSFIFNGIYSIILEERPILTTDKTSQTEELQNTLENNEVRLEELQMQRERIRELEVTIQEMKQLEETRKTSSLVLQNSSDIIPLSGYNNYRLIS